MNEKNDRKSRKTVFCADVGKRIACGDSGDAIGGNRAIRDGRDYRGDEGYDSRRRDTEALQLLGREPQPEKPFFAWFEEDVLGLSSESYRREFWRAANLRGHTIGEKPLTFAGWQRACGVPRRAAVADALLVAVCIGAPALVFYIVRRCIRRHLAKLRRPTYYESELLRRLALGKTRRMITHRRSHNPKPTMDQIRRAWNGARHNPQGALCLGGLLEDLECYVNNHAIGNDHVGYAGRYGGIKRLLEKEAPDLFKHYAALMRYKSIARRYRQACGVDDPIPADALLPLDGTTDDANPVEVTMTGDTGKAEATVADSVNPVAKTTGDVARKTVPSADGANQACMPSPSRMVAGMRFALREFEVEESSLEMAAKILKRCENSLISLEASLALELDPNCIGIGEARFGPTKSSDLLNVYGEVVEGLGTVGLGGTAFAVRRRRVTPDRVAVWLRRRQAVA